MEQSFKKIFILSLTASIIVGSVFGGLAGFLAGAMSHEQLDFFGLFSQIKKQPVIESGNNQVINTVEQESAVITAVEEVSPAVVSIIITKDLPVIERYYQETPGSDFFRQFFGDSFGDFFGFGAPRYRENGTEEREIGGGSGFLVSSDGYILTNKHVVADTEANYTVLMNDENKYEAEVLARDPLNDVAVLKIDADSLPYAELGESSGLKVGQSVIAIGNSLGEFSNTVSTGVISGLFRSVVAGGYGVGSEQLTGVIQTDASINVGNSGGPLLNLAGQVIGMNTAMAAGAENIGFAIPVNDIKNIFEDVKEHGRIVRPWLGVRYMLINEDIAEANKLDVDYGALILRGEERTDLAVIPGSPADKAGLAENDIILELNGEKINHDNQLANLIARYQPGDKIKLRVLHRGEEKEITVELDEME